MKEKIYTIPVNEAFKEECECPMCILEKKLENEYVDYMLGPSLMEPDSRIDTNEKGFCKRHFELLYNREENKLGLGLIIDTHLGYQLELLNKVYGNGKSVIDKDKNMPFLKSMIYKFRNKSTESGKVLDEIINILNSLENKCAICSKLDYTMDRYVDVIFYLWFKEDEFRNNFNNKKGFCLKHFHLLLEASKKYLNPKDAAIFNDNLINLQIENLKRINEEVNWFTKKFDYRNNDAPWGNSKDALPRSIQKIVGFCNLK
ncbi:MAG TPA: ABC transporter substrate-binding protein [Clostridiaceae bacterium]|nr:ABC transporter substrate-binding protein [Clostridiaceae bacterium]